MNGPPQERPEDPWFSIYESIRAWQLENAPEGADGPPIYWLGLFHYFFYYGWWMYGLEAAGADPLIDDIKAWFSYMFGWFQAGWQSLWNWIHDISLYIETLWNTITAAAIDAYTWIGDKIEGIINLVSNWAAILWEWLISDFWAAIDYLIVPIQEVLNYLVETFSEWFGLIQAAISSFLTDPVQWVYDLAAEIWDIISYLAGQLWDALIATGESIGSWLAGAIGSVIPTVTEALRDVVLWLWDTIKAAFVFVVDDVYPAVADATTGALGWLKDQFTHIVGLAYDELLHAARSFVPMTPEKAITLGAVMFGSAVGFGALAHGIALSVEAIPNLKYMGVHYISAFIARMGGFGAVSAATMGVIAGVSLRRPMTYYMQSLLRPMQPPERDLMMMAVKPDIPLDVFAKGMAYQGYSDYWIGRYQATMYHEPRYFELSMMAEDSAATSTWLYTKARRSGYSEADSVIFVSSIAKKAARTQRLDYYKQIFNLYKEGFISKDQFRGYLDNLEMRPEAQDFSIRAADFAYQYDLWKDLIYAHRTAFRRDLITQEELSASLTAMGLEPDRVDAIVYVEWARKTPSAVKAERKEVEKEWAALQKEYTRLYIEGFRKGLIDEAQLVVNLIAIGIKEQVAEVTARYEAVKRVPKPKYEEVGEEVLPKPPRPPELPE